MLIATALSIIALGLICWLLFTLAVYALPVLAGVLAGMLANQTGAGTIGSCLVGLVAGAVVLLLGQLLFTAARSPVLRSLIALIYAAPAAFAGCMGCSPLRHRPRLGARRSLLPELP